MPVVTQAESAAVQIAAALAWVPIGERRVVVNNLAPDVKRLVLSLFPDLWPTPGECPDGC